jgi:membrane protease YdiL (CAAX protease family)
LVSSGSDAREGAGWIWIFRLLAFAGLFLLAAFVALRVLVAAGVSFTTTLNWWGVLAMLAAALLATSILVAGVERRPLASVGLPTGAPALVALGRGAVMGCVLIGGAVLAMAIPGWVTWRATTGGGSIILAGGSLGLLLAGAAFVEELLFRGYPFQLLERRFGAVTAIAATSVAFSALHAANPNAAALPLVNITLAGVLLAVAYLRTRSLWFATGVHFGWNWIMGVSELSVSGLEMTMPGFDPIVRGPDLLTGGQFGPEGGLLVTAMSLLGIWWLWRFEPAGESLSRRLPGRRAGPG